MFQWVVFAELGVLTLVLAYQLADRCWRRAVIRRPALRILPVAAASTVMPTPLKDGLLTEATRVLPWYVGRCDTCGSGPGTGCWSICPNRHRREMHI